MEMEILGFKPAEERVTKVRNRVWKVRLAGKWAKWAKKVHEVDPNDIGGFGIRGIWISLPQQVEIHEWFDLIVVCSEGNKLTAFFATENGVYSKTYDWVAGKKKEVLSELQRLQKLMADVFAKKYLHSPDPAGQIPGAGEG